MAGELTGGGHDAPRPGLEVGLAYLTSKLEALEVYEQYQEDDDTGTFRRLLEEDREHATLLLEALRDRLARS